MKSTKVCDFCSLRDVRYVFPCETFTHRPELAPNLITISHDEWCACQPCTLLIHNGDYEALASRLLHTNPYLLGANITPHEQNLRIQTIKGFHDRFRIGRFPGPPVPLSLSLI